MELARRVEVVARKARKHHASLTGSNFYAEKLLQLRVDATNAFRELSERSVGDTSALAELIEATFSATATPEGRREALRSLTFELTTTWRNSVPAPSAGGQELFPLTILKETKRGYLLAIGRQMNGCYEACWYDACAVMMRRLLEGSIIEAFEANGLGAKITDKNNNYLQLTELISVALSESSWGKLSRNTREHLPKLRDLGHVSAHSRFFTARKADIDKVEFGCRVAIEEFLRLAKLL